MYYDLVLHLCFECLISLSVVMFHKRMHIKVLVLLMHQPLETKHPNTQTYHWQDTVVLCYVGGENPACRYANAHKHVQPLQLL